MNSPSDPVVTYNFSLQSYYQDGVRLSDHDIRVKNWRKRDGTLSHFDCCPLCGAHTEPA